MGPVRLVLCVALLHSATACTSKRPLAPGPPRPGSVEEYMECVDGDAFFDTPLPPLFFRESDGVPVDRYGTPFPTITGAVIPPRVAK